MAQLAAALSAEVSEVVTAEDALARAQAKAAAAVLVPPLEATAKTLEARSRPISPDLA